MSQLTLYNAPIPLPDRPQLRQERHFCRNQNQTGSKPRSGRPIHRPSFILGPPEDGAPDGAGKSRLPWCDKGVAPKVAVIPLWERWIFNKKAEKPGIKGGQAGLELSSCQGACPENG